MRIVKGWLLVGVLSLGGLVCAWLAGCDDDGPTKPVKATDYPVYIADRHRSMLFTYYPISRKIDSVSIPWLPEVGVSVSADGQKLYVACADNVVVIDACTRELIAELPYEPESVVAVSRDNDLIAITGDSLTILRTSDYSVLFRDTVPTEEACFSCDSRTLYCSAGWDSERVGFVYKVDLLDSLHPVERLSMVDGGVIYVAPSQHETKLFLYLGLPAMWTYAFEVYDVAQDSVIFADIFMPGGGKLVVTPNGRHVIYTHPSVSGTDPPSDGTFKIYDVAENRISDTILTWDFGPTGCRSFANSMAATPDNRWLVLLGGSDWSQQYVYLYDFHERALVDCVFLGKDVVLTNPAVQHMR